MPRKYSIFQEKKIPQWGLNQRPRDWVSSVFPLVFQIILHLPSTPLFVKDFEIKFYHTLYFYKNKQTLLMKRYKY